MRLVTRAFVLPCVLALSGFALPGILSAETAPHFPTNEDLRHTQSIGDPRLSQSGKQVLITVAESTANGGKTHLWLAGDASTPARQLTFSPKGEGKGEFAGRWMPDGSAILFLAKRGETTQIYRLPMSAGEATPYDLKIVPLPDPTDNASSAKPETRTDDKPEPLPIDVDSFEISADGKWLAVLAKDPQSPAQKKKDTDKDDADFIDHDPHGVHLFFVSLDKLGSAVGGLVRSDLAPDVQGIEWAPHSDRLAAVTESPNNVGDLHPARAAWVVEANADKWTITPLSKVPATVEENLAWSRDEASLLFLAQAQRDAPPGVKDLYAVNVKTGEFKALSREFNGNVDQIVTAEDNVALAEVSLGTTMTVARFPLTGGKPAPFSFEKSSVNNVNTNAEQNGWLYIQSATDTPPSLCFAQTLSAGCTTLPTPAVIPADWRNVAAQVILWKSADLTIEGLLYLPPHAEQGKVPLIVDVHGGPTGQFSASYSAFAQFLVGQGWAVFEPNPRGSTGYGAAFTAANKNDLGGGDYRDIMAGVDEVIAKFPIDTNKLALIGYSYGGEMAGFVEGKTDRFRAIVSGAPVIDQMSEYGTESSSYYDRWFYGYPWQHEQDAWRQSPISGVAHAKTPFLLLQGKSDTTDPAGQSEEMYRALRQAGVPVELVEYPREDHGPLARGMFGLPSREPWHGFDARKRLIDFIDKQFNTERKK